MRSVRGSIGRIGRGGIHLARHVPVLLACCYLYTAGMLVTRHRQVAHEVATVVRRRLFARRFVPVVPLVTLVPDPMDLHLEEPAYTRANVTLEELIVLVTLIHACGARTCLEIGTFDGRTALNLAANLPPDGRVYTIDLPREDIGRTALPLDPRDLKIIDKPAPGARFQGSPWAARITQLYGDSATFDFADALPSEGVDYIFIDGSHTRAYVESDSLRAIGLLRNGHGVIVWHDYGTWPGVLQALHALKRRDERFRNLKYIANTSLAVLIVGCPKGIG